MTLPTFRAVDQQTGIVADAPVGTIATTVREIDALRTQLATAEDELHDMRESRNAWADRTDAAEHALAKFQDQAVRIQELKAECAEWAQGFATAVAERDAARGERDTWRAGVSAVSR